MTDGMCAEHRLNAIAAASEPGDGVTRLPWTREHGQAVEIMTEWMKAAGLSVHLDAAGTLVGASPNPQGRPVLLLGSHQDSVRNGGRYDGIMGVALACLAAERFRGEWDNLPVAVEVLAFADEEGVRFPTALIGPRALAGTLDPGVLDLADGSGTTMRQAMEEFGLSTDTATSLRRDAANILGYAEVHIEQGPVLETADCAVGIVTGICGISRFMIDVTGETGHAGTVPMSGRKDAMVALSRMIAAITDEAERETGLRATFGQITVRPNVVNAIPNQAVATLEIRSVDDGQRKGFGKTAERLVSAIAARSGCNAMMDETYAQAATTCDDRLQHVLADSAGLAGVKAPHLASGATHDASAMADLCPTAMLFVRSQAGISHRPDEFTSADDMSVAIDVLANFIRLCGA